MQGACIENNFVFRAGCHVDKRIGREGQGDHDILSRVGQRLAIEGQTGRGSNKADLIAIGMRTGNAEIASESQRRTAANATRRSHPPRTAAYRDVGNINADVESDRRTADIELDLTARDHETGDRIQHCIKTGTIRRKPGAQEIERGRRQSVVDERRSQSRVDPALRQQHCGLKVGQIGRREACAPTSEQGGQISRRGIFILPQQLQRHMGQRRDVENPARTVGKRKQDGSAGPAAGGAQDERRRQAGSGNFERAQQTNRPAYDNTVGIDQIDSSTKRGPGRCSTGDRSRCGGSAATAIAQTTGQQKGRSQQT